MYHIYILTVFRQDTWKTETYTVKERIDAAKTGKTGACHLLRHLHGDDRRSTADRILDIITHRSHPEVEECQQKHSAPLATSARVKAAKRALNEWVAQFSPTMNQPWFPGSNFKERRSNCFCHLKCRLPLMHRRAMSNSVLDAYLAASKVHFSHSKRARDRSSPTGW